MKTAREIVEALGGTWRRGTVMCRCPAHDDSSPSLSVGETRDGRPLVFCFAGCPQAAVISALREKGLWEGEGYRDPSYPQGWTRKADGLRDRDERQMQVYARELWDRSDPIKGTLAETYLVARGIRRASGRWPDCLGFLPRLEHRPSGTTWPALIARITDETGKTLAVQRTWLERDGSAKAPVSPAKMTAGAMLRGAVRLGQPASTLGLAEGIETAMSATQLYGIPVWATLSANRLGAVEVPPGVTHVEIYADSGKVGMDQALEAARGLEFNGFVVDVIPPSAHFGDTHGDFNDVVRARA